jgi:hypothetical protein
MLPLTDLGVEGRGRCDHETNDATWSFELGADRNPLPYTFPFPSQFPKNSEREVVSSEPMNSMGVWIGSNERVAGNGNGYGYGNG